MNPLTVGLTAFSCLFGGTVLGMILRRRLPEHHQSADTQRVVNLGAGIIGTMAALVLGLLVASAKSSYDTQYSELNSVAARLALLDRGLAFYGPGTGPSRELLRRAVNEMVEQLWPSQQKGPAANSSNAPSATPGDLYESLQLLSPQNETQRSIKTQAIGLLLQIAEQRWLIIQQKKSSVSRPLLAILIFSLAINFLSFGLFAPRNATVIATLFLCAVASAGAIFLIIELYHPYGGLVQIPSSTLQSALSQ
jgi:hypothetical protein